MKRSLVLLLLAATPVMSQIPQAVPVSRQQNPQPGEILINVKNDGTVVVGNRVLTRKELAEHLSAISTLHKGQLVRLRGDANCPYQTIVEIIGLCQTAGIWNSSFDTQRQQPPSE